MNLTRFQKLALGIAALLVWLGAFGAFTGRQLYEAGNTVVRWIFEQRLQQEAGAALDVLEKLSSEPFGGKTQWLKTSLGATQYDNVNFYLYKADTLEDWIGGTTEPPHYFKEFYRPTVHKWRGGLDLWLVKSTDEKSCVAQIPIVREYPIQNAYLGKETPLIKTLGRRFHIDKPGALPISIALESGQEVCSLSPLPTPEWFPVLGYICFVAFLALLVLYQRDMFSLYWYLALAAFYAVCRIGGSSMVLNQCDLYNPEVYAGLVPHLALGDLLLMAFAIGKILPWTKQWQINTFLHLFLAMLLGIVAQDVVANSVIPIDTTRIFEFGPWSILTFLSMGIWLKATMIDFELPPIRLIAVSTGAVLLMGILGFLLFGTSLYGLILPVTTILAHSITKSYISSPLVRGLVLFVLSIGSLYLPVHAQTVANEESKWMLATKKLGEARDYTAEFLLKNTISQMEQDPIIKTYFNNHLLPSSLINERLDKIYLRGYLNRFGHEVLYISRKPKLLSTWNGQLAERIETAKRYGSIEVSPGLYTFNNDRFRPSYIVEVSAVLKGDTLGLMQVLLEEKALYDKSIYPHLLLGPVQPVPTHDMIYALYKNGKLVVDQGRLPFPRSMTTPSSLLSTLPEGYDYQVVSPSSDILLVGAVQTKGIMGLLGGIGVFFFLVGVAGLLGLLLKNLWQALRQPRSYWISLSLQNRIVFVTTGSVFVMFLLLAYVNLSYFKTKAEDTFSQELMEKTEKAQAALSVLIDHNGLDALHKDLLLDELLLFSEIHQVDVDFFHVNGELLGSSQRALYDNGILEPRMNGAARHKLLHQGSMLHLQNEHIGKLHYVSAYAPVYSLEKLIGFVQLPYFTRNLDVKDEQAGVLVALLNFYVIILLALGLFSTFIARGLARPLKAISEQLRTTSLTRHNEKIHWAHDDEIGQLVKGYNDMVEQLEVSAKQLVNSKKAEAWQEMAKQVAHEIKNPLTPMKLHMQRLIRASREGHPDFDKILEKVGAVIVDQIEQLSKIAGEFSTYAQMPVPNMSLLNLVTLTEQIADFYNTDKPVVFPVFPSGPITLYADRDQLFRALNNLVKNAIQSAPNGLEARVDVVVERIGYKGVRISIADNGTGISPEVADKIFFPNFSTKTSGMGMGLSIVKQIVENHNGKIWHEPHSKGGTIFIIEFHLV